MSEVATRPLIRQKNHFQAERRATGAYRSGYPQPVSQADMFADAQNLERVKAAINAMPPVPPAETRPVQVNPEVASVANLGARIDVLRQQPVFEKRAA